MPYCGYNGNFDHCYGHIGSNGYNNVVQHHHNPHVPVESTSMGGPIGVPMGRNGSSARTCTRAEHEHLTSQEAAEYLTLGTRVRLPLGPDGRIVKIFVRHQDHRDDPVGSPSVTIPVGGPMGADGSSADTFAQTRHDQHVPTESPRGTRVRLPPGPDGRMVNVFVRHRHRHHVSVGSFWVASLVGGPMGKDGSSASSADTFAQHHHDLVESHSLPYTVRLPPRENGSSASTPAQQHVRLKVPRR